MHPDRIGTMLLFVSMRKIFTPRELGTLVRRARKARRLTQIQLADHANISRSAVQRLEEGRGAANLATVFKLLHMLSLDLAVASRRPGDLLEPDDAG